MVGFVSCKHTLLANILIHKKKNKIPTATNKREHTHVHIPFMRFSFVVSNSMLELCLRYFEHTTFYQFSLVALYHFSFIPLPFFIFFYTKVKCGRDHSLSRNELGCFSIVNCTGNERISESRVILFNFKYSELRAILFNSKCILNYVQYYSILNVF